MAKKHIIDEDFSTKIIKIAKEKFGSQKKMAEELGLRPSTISEWINGRNRPSFEVLKELCLKAEISLDYLVLGKTFDTEEVSPDLFDDVYYYTYKWASKEGFPTNGSFFLGVYDMVVQELKKGNKEPIEKIIDNLKPTILKLRKIK